MAFREVVRKKQALTKSECIEILKSEKRGVLACLGDDDYPYALPLNHFYNEEDGKLYFHSGKVGHKVEAIKKHSKVSFCVYDSGYKKEGEWALNIKSVIVFGRIEIIEDYEKAMELCRELSYKFTDDKKYIAKEIEKSGKGTLVFAINPEHITGKLVNEA